MHSAKYIHLFSATTLFAELCIPSSINAWNNLDTQIRNSESYPSFCYKLKKDLFSSIKIPNYYLKGKRKLSVLHCKLRNNCSDLYYDLYYNHLHDSPICDCLEDIENAEHFIFKCSRYNISRLILFNRTRAFHPLKVNAVLYGNQNLHDDDNRLLLDAVQAFIQDIKRFNN